MRNDRDDEAERRRREARGLATERASERRRLERLEQWSKTPLDPAVEEALHGTSPEVAWSHLQCVLFQGFDTYPEKAEQLMENYQPPYDEESLQIMLQNLNPKVGLKHLLGCGTITDLSDLVHNADPLEVLEQVLWMVTLSSERQSDPAN